MKDTINILGNFFIFFILIFVNVNFLKMTEEKSFQIASFSILLFIISKIEYKVRKK